MLTRSALLSTRTLLLPRTASLATPRTTPLRAFHASNMSSSVYQTFASSDAPAALGPYSQSVVYNGVAYISGCVPFDPKTMKIVEGGEGDTTQEGVIEKQTEQALTNLFAVLKAAGADKSSVLKTTVFLKDMNNFKRINGVYEKMFAPHKPARSAVEVARLPFDVGVEVECIAAVINKQ